MGPPAIDTMSFNSRVAEFSVDLVNQSIFTTGISSTVNGSSESCTSDKNSATPPQDPHSTSDLRGILPKQSMAERLRRAKNHAPSKISNQQGQSMGHGVPKFFNMPALLAQYPVQREREIAQQQNHRVENNSTLNKGQQSSFSSPVPYQQQFMQSGNNGNNMEQSTHGFYKDDSNDGMPSNWTFGSLDNSVLTGFSGFEFSLQEGQDINSHLNGGAWDGSTFQA